MPGFVLHLGATVLCSHGGQAMPTAPNPRVLVGGQPVTTQAAPYMVAGCPFVTPGGNGPCVSAQWVVAATRVFAGGQPVLLQDSVAICAPTGTPLTVALTQLRVRELSVDVAFPLSFDGRGRTAQATDHVRDMIEQVLFTAPGERVNRPTFGSGVMQLVFAPNGDALAATTQMSVQGALQQWLGEHILVEAVEVANDDAKLTVTIQYTLRATGAREVQAFTQR